MSFNASSIPKRQQWRNELLMKPSDMVPKPNNEFFNEPPQLKYPGHPGYPSQQGHQSHPIFAGHPAPPAHLVHPGRPSHGGTSGRGQLCHPGHATHSEQACKRPRQMLTNASVCCEQPNCHRAKVEQMPELYLQEPATPFALVPPTQGRDSQSGKKDIPAPHPDHDYVYCPHGKGGQLVTICCTGRNCDSSTKIDEGIHMGFPDIHMCHPEFQACPPDVQMGAPDVQMGAPDVQMGPSDTYMGPSAEKRARTSYNQYKY